MMFCKLWVQGDSEFSFLAEAIIMSLVPLFFVCVCVCFLDLDEDGACEHVEHQASCPVCLCVLLRGVIAVASLAGQCYELRRISTFKIAVTEFR